tara:strand:- start:241 stop:498 length:258 start_codon:yes stop_codon:yes gene_type:complete
LIIESTINKPPITKLGVIKMPDKNLHRVFMTVVIASIAWLFLTVSSLKVEQKLMQYKISLVIESMKVQSETLQILHNKLSDEFGW